MRFTTTTTSTNSEGSHSAIAFPNSGSRSKGTVPPECSGVSKKNLVNINTTNRIIVTQQRPSQRRSFRRRSFPSRYDTNTTNGIDTNTTMAVVPGVLPCNSSGSSSTTGPSDISATNASDECLPRRRFTSTKRRSSIATESTAYFSAETATAACAASLEFDPECETLHKHYSRNRYGILTPSTTPAAKSATSLVQQQGQSKHHGHHPQKETMKRHRRDKTATYGMVGAGVGTLILPIVGTVVGGVLSGYVANQSLKRTEQKIQRKWERDQFQKDASASPAARHAVFA